MELLPCSCQCCKRHADQRAFFTPLSPNERELRSIVKEFLEAVTIAANLPKTGLSLTESFVRRCYAALGKDL